MNITIKNRRQFMKATVAAMGAGLPNLAFAAKAEIVPPVISLLLEDSDPIIGAAVLEGEGPSEGPNFDSNTQTLSQGSNFIERYFTYFRPDFSAAPEREHGFDDLTAQLPANVSQNVTLTISVLSPAVADIDVVTPTQTVSSDANGLATFAKVTFDRSFGPSDQFSNHTFELRFSSTGFDDYVIEVECDFSPYLTDARFTLEAEGAQTNPGTRFFNGSENTLDDFYTTYRPDYFGSGSGPEFGLDNPGVQLSPAPSSSLDVMLTAEVISGGQISVTPATATQVVSTSSSFVQFSKILFTPNQFGPAGTSDTEVVTNHTIRLTFSAEGYSSATTELTLDLEPNPIE